MLKKIKYIGQRILFKNNQRKTNREVFSEIYKKHLWDEGDNSQKQPYYSGKGSDDSYGAAYAEFILNFMQENHIESVVDLGCGDFRVASKFAGQCKKYTGIDCVSELVTYNNKKYGSEQIHFECLDITNDKLPGGGRSYVWSDRCCSI